MALETLLEHESGVLMQYHRILSAEFNFHNDEIIIVVQGFVDASAANAARSPLAHEVVRLKLSDLKSDPRRFLYPILQQLAVSPFIDSISTDPPVAAEVPELTEKAKERPKLPAITPAPLPPAPPTQGEGPL